MKRLPILFTGFLCLALSSACSGAESSWDEACSELAAIFAKPQSQQDPVSRRPRSATPAFGYAPEKLFMPERPATLGQTLSQKVQEVIQIIPTPQSAEEFMAQLKVRATLLREQAAKEKKEKTNGCFGRASFLESAKKPKRARELQRAWRKFQASKANKDNRG